MNYRLPTRALAVVLLFSMSLWVGCDSSVSSDSDNSSGPLIPLEEGDTYSFRVEDTSEGETSEGQADLLVAGNTTIDGTTYREVELNAVFSDGETTSRTLVAREIENGLYISDTVYGGDNPNNLIGFELRTSASAGDTYVHTDEKGKSYDVSVSEETTTVPAGTFEVIVYRVVRQERPYTETVFIAPGIGPVRFESEYGSYYESSMRLVSTNVN